MGGKNKEFEITRNEDETQFRRSFSPKKDTRKPGRDLLRFLDNRQVNICSKSIYA